MYPVRHEHECGTHGVVRKGSKGGDGFGRLDVSGFPRCGR